jgi:hypothetical protein
VISVATFRALWVAVAIQVLGRLLDLRWHLANDEFEGTSQQFEAHWLLWIGVLATLAVAAFAIAQRPRIAGYRGYLTTLIAAGAYVPVSVWHFIEHANGNDPGLAHLLLALTQIAMIAGAVWATLLVRGRRELQRA